MHVLAKLPPESMSTNVKYSFAIIVLIQIVLTKVFQFPIKFGLKIMFFILLL